MRLRRIVLFAMIGLGAASAALGSGMAAEPATAMVVPIQGTIDARISATEMRDALGGAGVPVLTYVGKAPAADAEYTWGERLARFATDPDVSGLLLSIGILGLLIEMQTLHGIAGLIGLSAFGLFFGTHVYAGFSNALVIGLALLGVGAILFELHVLPGHGVAGLLGVVALAAAVLLAFGLPFVFVAVQSLSVAIVLSVLCFWLTTRFLPENAFVQRLALQASQDARYVASSDHSTLLGKTGVAASFLRPAGVATIEGRRVDVLTEGNFLTAGTPIKVTRVEGARIFVVSLETADAPALQRGSA